VYLQEFAYEDGFLGCYSAESPVTGSSVGVATGYGLDGPGSNLSDGEIFRTLPHQPCSPPNLLYNEYRVFPGGKATGACR